MVDAAGAASGAAAAVPDPGPNAPPARRTSKSTSRLAIGAAVALGVLVGLGLFTFGYGDGAAYLRDDPASCANCHVMQGHFDAWSQSTHRHIATCNDCHLPPHAAGKWLTKADNGFFHSLAFTTGGFEEPIQIKPRNRRVTQAACLHCHGDFVDSMRPHALGAHGTGSHGTGSDMTLCVHCHADVGHAQR